MGELKMALTAIIEEHGGPEQFKLVDLDVGEPGNGEVRIAHKAVGLNFIDVYQRTGLYPMQLPHPMGMEAAGVIEAVGDGVTHLKAGDRAAYASNPPGAYSEARIMPAAQVCPLPDGISFEEGAAMMLKGMTVEYLFHRTSPLKSGDTVLFHAAAGGVGLLACQWARSEGITLIGTAGTDEKCIKAKELGAELSINYKKEDFVEKINDYTNKKGVNIVLDMIGAEYFDKNLSILKVNGKLVIIAFQSGFQKNLNLLPILIKRLTVTGSTLRPRTPEEKRLIANSLYKKVWPLIEKGLVMPQIYGTYKLEDANKAHTLMESSQHIGKIVLTV